MLKVATRPVHFKRDVKIFYDPIRWIFKDSFLWSLPFWAPFKCHLVDEIRFYKKEFTVKIDGEFYHYYLDEVRIELRYSVWSKTSSNPGMVLHIFSKDGDHLRLVVGKAMPHIGHGSFSKNSRELIYQFARRSFRFREVRGAMNPSGTLILASVLAIGLVFTL